MKAQPFEKAIPCCPICGQGVQEIKTQPLEFISKIQSEAAYWKERCEAAESYIREINSHCNTAEEEMAAANKWQTLKQKEVK